MAKRKVVVDTSGFGVTIKTKKPSYEPKGVAGPPSPGNKKPPKPGQTLSTTVSQPSRPAPTTAPTRQPRVRRRPSPAQQAQAQIQRRVLSGKKATPTQKRLIAKRPKLERTLAQKRLKQKPVRVELGLKAGEKPPKPVIKKLAQGQKPKKIKAQRPAKPLRKPPRKKPTPRQKRVLRKPYPGLDREQAQTLETVLGQGVKAGATRKELLAATETAIVESEIRNLNYGDADSLGWRQERASQYGAENATDVKGGAKRFFQESVADTGGSRGKGMTAGQLAQAIQGSAFPERYDEVKGQAVPLLKTFKKKVEASGGEIPKGPQKVKGAWAGSKAKLAQTLDGIVPRSEWKEDKRTPEENTAVGGDSDSDHLTTNTGSFAADIPPNPAHYAKLRKRLGLPPAETGSDTVVKDGYRYQLIFGAQYDHADHIHLGVRWEGAGVPPGTTLGGPIGTSSSAGAAVGGATTATTAATGKRAAPAKRRKHKKRKRVRIPELAAIELPELDFKPTETPYSEYVKQRAAKVSL